MIKEFVVNKHSTHGTIRDSRPLVLHLFLLVAFNQQDSIGVDKKHIT